MGFPTTPITGPDRITVDVREWVWNEFRRIAASAGCALKEKRIDPGLREMTVSGRAAELGTFVHMMCESDLCGRDFTKLMSNARW